MESLTELEEFIGTLDLAPEEERRIARILEKLREETAASWRGLDSDWPATERAFLCAFFGGGGCLGGEKKKACISAGFLALGSPVDHFSSRFGPVTVAAIWL